MHVLVCMCSNVRQFHTAESIIQLCFRAQLFTVRPCFVGHNHSPQGGGGLAQEVGTCSRHPYGFGSC